ncbi:unnamed protein product [Timema podura]|uniref:Uncharacterized protein n=1 Tax=Timema podura TaxID=61482 RepID=A0ABN7P4I7_TIMPD|nr:unnamed protein product [Timema podura]
MDEWAVPVKIEPEVDLEYPQQEIKLEIKTEIDLPIKSEFDEGLQCYQQQRGQQPLLPFPPIKEELNDSDGYGEKVREKYSNVLNSATGLQKYLN